MTNPQEAIKLAKVATTELKKEIAVIAVKKAVAAIQLKKADPATCPNSAEPIMRLVKVGTGDKKVEVGRTERDGMDVQEAEKPAKVISIDLKQAVAAITFKKVVAVMSAAKQAESVINLYPKKADSAAGLKIPDPPKCMQKADTTGEIVYLGAKAMETRMKAAEAVVQVESATKKKRKRKDKRGGKKHKKGRK